jgi:hypothetical protein
MSDEKETTPEEAGAEFAHHPIFGIWAIDENTNKKAFVIRCGCGETVYYIEKDIFEEPESRVYPGMTIDAFQKMHKDYQKFKGYKRQIQRVALAQHAEQHPECPAVEKMKKDAGVTTIQELPNPFRDTV